MARKRIEIRENLKENGFLFCFNMLNFMKKEALIEKSRVFTEITKAISKCYESAIPISARLLGQCRAYTISSNDSLNKWLENGEQNTRNMLIFARKANEIHVLWFGPCNETDCLGSLLEKLYRSHCILKEIVEVSKMMQENKDLNEEALKKKLIEKYWSVVQDSLNRIEAKKTELKGFAYQVLDKPTADKLTKQLTASSGKVLVKGVSAILLAEIAEEIGRKIAAILATKTASKAAAKGGSSHASKMAAKSVPVLSLVVGFGFGVWRYWQGDMTGAGLEVVSGAAACVPGSGTAASLAIDAGLIARDVYEARNIESAEIKDLKDEMKSLDESLKDLYENYDNALSEYEFVKEIFEVGITLSHLEGEVQILEEIVSTFDEMCESFQFVP